MSKITEITTLRGMTATEITALIPAKASKADKLHLAAILRTERLEGSGVPKKPSLTLYTALTGEVFDFDRKDRLTRKQIKSGTPTLNQREAAGEAAPAKAKAKAKPAKSANKAPSLAAMVAAMDKMDDEGLLAFFQGVMDKRTGK